MQNRCSFENGYLYNEYEKHSIVCTSALMIVLFSRDSIVKKNFGLRIIFSLAKFREWANVEKCPVRTPDPTSIDNIVNGVKIPDNNGLPVVRQRKHS